MVRSSIIAGLIALVAIQAEAQGVEGLYVETYAVSPPVDSSGLPLITYRVYVDLAPGYRLQMVYGDKNHQLMLKTTTWFFNDKENGVKYAHELNADDLNKWPLALDTWVTVGVASNRHMGIPKGQDPDGSVLECPPYPKRELMSGGREVLDAVPLCAADGLVNDTSKKEVVPFKFASGYLDKVRGSVLETTDGAWAVLGGVQGKDEENRVLIAQLSTTGQLYLLLNLQLGAPDGKPVKYVASDPQEGEIQVDALTYGKRR